MRIKTILFDLDGVLYIGDNPVPGAVEVIEELRTSGFGLRFITNTSTKLPQEIIRKLTNFGFNVSSEELFTPLRSARDYLISVSLSRMYPVINSEILPYFKEFIIDQENPEFILIGDIGDKWNYQLMNKIFNFTMNGAKLIALHQGKFYNSGTGNVLDIGAFISGIEYSANVRAAVFGKPDLNFFNSAVATTKCDKGEILMVGDDLDNDIAGAQKSGYKTVLTKTGKFNVNYVQLSDIKPDYLIESVRDLPKLIKEIK